jgi:hypothetical protein
MAKAKAATFYAIERAALHRLEVASVLDMLRYDGATIQCNAPLGFYLLRTEGSGPELGRWRSFGVLIDARLVDRSEAVVKERCRALTAAALELDDDNGDWDFEQAAMAATPGLRGRL